MKISLLSERVTFQKNSPVTDAIGNHTNEWTDYFSCAAYAAASAYKQQEEEKAGNIVDGDALTFSVRYCSELANLDNSHYRVIFHEATYNITSVDMMNYDKKSIKVSCSTERKWQAEK